MARGHEVEASVLAQYDSGLTAVRGATRPTTAVNRQQPNKHDGDYFTIESGR